MIGSMGRREGGRVLGGFGARVWEGGYIDHLLYLRVLHVCVYVLETELWTTLRFQQQILRYQAMPWLWGLVAGFSPGLLFGPVHVGYVVDSGTGTGFSPSA